MHDYPSQYYFSRCCRIVFIILLYQNFFGKQTYNLINIVFIICSKIRTQNRFVYVFAFLSEKRIRQQKQNLIITASAQLFQNQNLHYPHTRAGNLFPIHCYAAHRICRSHLYPHTDCQIQEFCPCQGIQQANDNW